MKSLRWLFLTVVLAWPAVALADYYDGLRAFDAGDYAAAFPPAEMLEAVVEERYAAQQARPR